jgi:RND family efflux transporter MFP subunit
MNLKKYTLLMATSIVLFACQSVDNAATDGTNKSEEKTDAKIQTVEVIHPSTSSFDAEVLVTGTAKANQIVTVYAMESGIITSIIKDIGDYVKKGETIATLSNPEISRRVSELQTALNGKKSTYDRLNAIQTSTPALTTLQAVEEAKTNYLLATEALKSNQDRQRYLTIRAPFNGIITKRFVDKGALIQSGLSQSKPQGVVEIQDINPIRLSVPLAESDIASTKEGMLAKVSFPELANQLFDAKISRTAGVLDGMSKTMDIEIDLNNSKGLIKPGMYAKVLLQNKSRNGVVSLPVTAQSIFKNQPYVLVVNEDNVVEKINLQKGLSNKDYFEVLNAEITAETKVIIQGKGLVKEDDRVNPINKSQ